MGDARCQLLMPPIFPHTPKLPAAYIDKTTHVVYIHGMPNPSTRTITLYRIKCRQCGHEWESQLEHPRQCRMCWSRKWDKPKQA